jgi:DNA transformation protein and related proteins
MAQDSAKRETDELTSLPNIGSVVAQKLKAAGVMTPQQLKALGSVEVAVRLRTLAARPEDAPCASMLSGLEGAIRGVRWHAIPKHERDVLWQRYQAQCQEKDGRR